MLSENWVGYIFLYCFLGFYETRKKGAADVEAHCLHGQTNDMLPLTHRFGCYPEIWMHVIFLKKLQFSEKNPQSCGYMKKSEWLWFM
jgi:hypothetical protein